uniref:Purple acid phosphatase n=1 Tax=Setaria italica TaxID=4555 RepID=K3Y7X5_SETIT
MAPSPTLTPNLPTLHRPVPAREGRKISTDGGMRDGRWQVNEEVRAYGTGGGTKLDQSARDGAGWSLGRPPPSYHQGEHTGRSFGDFLLLAFPFIPIILVFIVSGNVGMPFGLLCALVFLVANHGLPMKSNFRLVLLMVHISMVGPDKMRVTWITQDDAPAIVEYGTTSGSYPLSATGSTTTYSYVLYHSGKIHDAVIGPLQPSTTYYYRCSSNPSREFSFRTPPATLPFKFVVVGDFGQTGWTASTLKHIAAADYDMLLLPGDLSYADYIQSRWDSYGRLVEPLASARPWMMTEGNHEIEKLPFVKPFQGLQRAVAHAVRRRRLAVGRQPLLLLRRRRRRRARHHAGLLHRLRRRQRAAPVAPARPGGDRPRQDGVRGSAGARAVVQ